MCAAIASNTATLIATMIKKNFPKAHRFLKSVVKRTRRERVRCQRVPMR